jgi:methionyl-tRNA synthetase
MDFWGPGDHSKLIHFIGKDIVYFHALFWPVMLDSAKFKIPDRIFVHGFLNIQEEKMSKTRGTFILASEFAEKMKHPLSRQYLRFYLASKLTDGATDIDFNPDEFCDKVNSTLVNNIGNLHHRTFVFIDRYFGSVVPDQDWDSAMSAAVVEAGGKIAECYDRADYKSAVEKIHALASAGNKYYQDMAPWALIKTDPKAAGKVMVTCANLVRALAVFLKPIIPDIAGSVETQLGQNFVWKDHEFGIRNAKLSATAKIALPITIEDFALLTGNAAPAAQQAPAAAEATQYADISDFSKILLRIGTVESAEPVPKSDKLLKLTVNDGKAKRQIVSGIAKHYSPEKLIGRQIAFIANLKPAKIMGIKSEGMILAAGDGKSLSLIIPDMPVAPGAEIS